MASKKNNSVRILPISIVIFIILAIIALFIILNKGKIGGYSLVKIETTSDSENSNSESDKEVELEISVENKYLSVKNKEKKELLITLDGEEISADDIELTSSNEEIIKIEDGKAIAVSEGKATITAKKDNVEKSIDLQAIIPIQTMNFTATNSNIRVGKSLQMKLVAKPSDATVDTLKYESSDEEIATVNNNGIVTGVSPGKVTITVKDEYSGNEKNVNLNIR